MRLPLRLGPDGDTFQYLPPTNISNLATGRFQYSASSLRVGGQRRSGLSLFRTFTLHSVPPLFKNGHQSGVEVCPLPEPMLRA